MNNKTIYKNAKFYSMDEKTPNFSYLVVENSRITYIGDKEIYEISENDQVIDLDNKTVFPAFFESHTHAPGLAYDTLFNVNLYSALTEKETIEMISDFVEKHPEKSSYYGRGFNTCLFQGIEGVIGPRKERLDNICKDKPIILSDWGAIVNGLTARP